MGRLKDLTECRNVVLGKLLCNQKILKAVKYNDYNFLDKSDVKIDDVMYKNIFPFNFLPTTEDEISNKKTYLTLSITDFSPAGGKRFRASNLFVFVFTHKDLMQCDIPSGDLRIDYLVSEVDDCLSELSGVGIGELEFVGMKEYRVHADYVGYALQYRPVFRG